MLDETYWAVRGGGAYPNGDKSPRLQHGSIGDCVFFPNGLHLVEARPHLPRVNGTDAAFWAVRSYGGPLDACMLAAGRWRSGSSPRSRSGYLRR